MADAFSKEGVAAAAIFAATPNTVRAQAFSDLRTGAVACLFAVDLFEEGLDLPDVDTLLMLRPTQSATVFLRQLGRGLRRSRRKAVLTVLAFGAEPFIFLGTVDYISHRGERPIAITWKLRRPMPMDVFESGAVVAS